jgi:2-oxoglutarate dehydrogenase E1 component
LSASDFVNIANAEFIERMAEVYRRDPDSLDPEWRAFFAGVELGRDGLGAAGALTGGDGAAEAAATGPARGLPAPTGLVNAYRDLGHLLARIDPLSDPPASHPLLELSQHSIGEADLDRPCDPATFRGPAPATLRDLLESLRTTYCGTLGVEFTHIRDREHRLWLEERMEGSLNRPELDRATRLRIYTKLVEAESFEQFLQRKYPGQKRFSVEGGDSLIPILEAIIEEGAASAVEQIVLGMAHRGRLNVLANIVRKPYEMILSEFEGSTLPDWVQGDGDVKYHQGYSRDYHASNGQTVHVSLTPNPSHLEVVNPVVEGKVRAKQNLLGDRERRRVVPVLVHGDASFVGQGVVPETFLLSHLHGYFTGGTLHIVHNNQVGFTTPPRAARPMRYATDIARIVESPVFHVNGDDPEMAVHAVKLAMGFRQAFRRDVFIDLVCFRRHGHNELDEPTFTQPVMYQRIAAHPTTREIYEEKLLREGAFTPAELEAVRSEVAEILELALSYARDFRPRQQVFSFGDAWEGFGPPPDDRIAATAVPAEALVEIAERAATLPTDFTAHPKVAKVYEARLEAVRKGRGIDWGGAEMLAFGSLMREGTSVRLSGQDSGRGTFSHRHSVLHDQNTGAVHVPLNEVVRGREKPAYYLVLDSPLSESAVLGFEYGYSSAAPHILTLWEAQFGDFANGAQTVIDTYIAAGESKWQRASGLVLLLPHGYEGQGPEHSSARLERFLQLCGDDNLQVVVPTTAAQYFHVLRRQMRRPFRKPLVVLTPKSLLRFAPSSSTLAELTEGTFQTVLPDPIHVAPEDVRSIAFASGKVFYDIAKAREERPAHEVTILRIEELYPFPEREIQRAIAAVPHATDVVWVQEEPINMGAWSYVAPRLAQAIGPERTLRYAGRDEAASPATGSYRLHEKEQAAFLAKVFDGVPPPSEPKRKLKRSQVSERGPSRRAEARSG